MFWPCETRTSTCLSFATISSGLYRFLAIAVLLDVKDIPQVGPLQWGWITLARTCLRRAWHSLLLSDMSQTGGSSPPTLGRIVQGSVGRCEVVHRGKKFS